jgi:RIO-like serine/threonine protein kinase
MQLVTYDCEPMIDWEQVYYYKDEDDDDNASNDIETYRTWLRREFSIEPVTDGEEMDSLVAKAQEQYGERFKAWMGRFYREA